MMTIGHNHDTAYKTLAKYLSVELQKFPNLYNLKGLEDRGDNFVSLVREGLKQDSDILIRLLKKTGTPKGLLPKILLTVSPQIETIEEQFSILEKLPSSIIIKNNLTDKKIAFKGDRYKFRVKAQLAIFSRSDYTIRELSLRVLNILRKLKYLTYCLKIFDDENPNDLNILEDFGKLKILDIDSSAYVQEDNEGAKLLVSSLDFYIGTEFFYLEKSDFDIEQTVQKEETEIKVKLPTTDKGCE